MFKRYIDNYGSTLFNDVQSQIVDSSLDYEYMRDLLVGRYFSLELRQQSEVNIDDQRLPNKQFEENSIKSDQLVTIIEIGFQKLS